MLKGTEVEQIAVAGPKISTIDGSINPFRAWLIIFAR
jgi:hypothetical protein